MYYLSVLVSDSLNKYFTDSVRGTLMAFSLHFRLNSSEVPFYPELADNSLSAHTDLHFHVTKSCKFFWIIGPAPLKIISCFIHNSS